MTNTRSHDIAFPVHLMELDSFEWNGMWYIAGESLTFRSEADVDAYIAGTVEEEREYTQYPFLFGIFGGTPKVRKYMVRVRP